MGAFRVNIGIGAIFVACGVTAASLVAQSGQTARSTKTYTPPKTPWGDPDLQGIWPSTAMVGVPFERPPQFGNRLYLTEAEFKTAPERRRAPEHAGQRVVQRRRREAGRRRDG